MKTTKLIVALMLLCPVLSGAATEDVPLTQIRKHDVDPDGTAGACDGVEFSKDGALYAAGDNHGVARVYRTSDGTYLGKATHDYEGGVCAKSSAEINGIAFSADGLFLATGDGKNDGTKIWDATLFNDTTPPALTNAIHHKVQGKETDGLDFSPNNKWLAVAADADLVIFDQQNNFNTLKTIGAESGQGAINSVDFSSDSKYIVFSGGGDDWIYIYSTPEFSGENNWVFQYKFRTSNHQSVKSVRFSPDDKYIALGSRNQRCEVWKRVNDDWTNWTFVAFISHAGENQTPLPCDDTDSNAAIEAVEWSSDGQYLITGGLISGRLHLWNTSDWSHVGWILGQETNRQIEFIDVFENMVIVGGDEGGIRLFEFTPVKVFDKMAPVKMKVYPNPLGVNFTIELDTEMDRVEILNILGQRVQQINVASSREVLVNSSELDYGIYLVRCYQNSRLICTDKIMK